MKKEFLTLNEASQAEEGQKPHSMLEVSLSSFL